MGSSPYTNTRTRIATWVCDDPDTYASHKVDQTSTPSLVPPMVTLELATSDGTVRVTGTITP